MIPVGYVSGWGVKKILDGTKPISSKTLQIAAGKNVKWKEIMREKGEPYLIDYI